MDPSDLFVMILAALVILPLAGGLVSQYHSDVPLTPLNWLALMGGGIAVTALAFWALVSLCVFTVEMVMDTVEMALNSLLPVRRMDYREVLARRERALLARLYADVLLDKEAGGVSVFGLAMWLNQVGLTQVFSPEDVAEVLICLKADQRLQRARGGI